MAWPLAKRSSFEALKDERDCYRLALIAVDQNLDKCSFEEWHEPTTDALNDIDIIFCRTLDT